MKIQVSPATFIAFFSLFISFASFSQISGKPGVYIRQMVVNDSIAKISITTNLENHSGKRKTVELRCSIWDNKEFITRDIRLVELESSVTVSVTQDLDFGMPELWNGPEHPFLYKVIVEVKENGKILGFVTQPLGLRKFGFDNDNRFVLNNKIFPLLGVYFDDTTNNPDDPDGYLKLKIQLQNVCSSGANTIYLPSQLQKDQAYSLCDSLGLILWGTMNTNITNETGTRNITDFIHQNYNHPSIFFWSLKNRNRQHKSQLFISEKTGCEQFERLTDVVKKEDPGRLTFHESDVWLIPFDSIDRNRNDDRFHWYKARWSAEPSIYIPGKKDTVHKDTLKKLISYCNLDDPELEVNGSTINDRKDGTSVIDFYWEKVGLKKGMNNVRVFARKRGKQIEDTWYFEVK